MGQSGIDLVIKRAIERYGDPDYEPPVSLMDRPNTVLFPALEESSGGMPQGMGSPLGEFAMQMSDGLMGGGDMGGGGEMDMMSALMGGGGMGGDPMMGGVDAAAMMMQPDAQQGPAPGPSPEEQMPLPGVM